MQQGISEAGSKSKVAALRVCCAGRTMMGCCRYRNNEKGSIPPLMRVVIIGGSGHIGSYLTPRLIEAGHAVLCVSRGLKQPYVAHAAWSWVQRVVLGRAVEEAAGGFGGSTRQTRPRWLLGLTPFTP